MYEYDKSKAAEDRAYIYESPDGGETIYRRAVGAPHSQRELIQEKKSSTLVIEWTANDIKQIRNDLSFSDACEVIQYLSENYDGKRGITWSIVKETVERLFP